jgi:hypothetical protein
MAKTPVEIKSLARAHTAAAINVLDRRDLGQVPHPAQDKPQ